MSLDDRGAPQTAPAPRRRHTARNLLLGLVAVLVVVALVAGAYLWNLAHTFDTRRQVIENAFPEESLRPAAGSAQDRGTTVLVLGADQQDSGERADSIMLMHVPEDGGQVFVMSIMRDFWVDIPGVGEAKINSALDNGGVPLMVRTVEDLVGVRVDQVAEVDFAGFEGLTDALGGVTVDVPQDFVSWTKKLQFEQGPQHLDGEAALEFVRERRSFASGDFQRVENQRAFVKALLDKALSRETLTNPARVQDVVTGFAPYVNVSEGLDAAWIAGLAPDLVGLSSQDVRMFTAPNEGIGFSADGQSIVVPDEQALGEIGVAISEDKLGEYVATLNPADQ